LIRTPPVTRASNVFNLEQPRVRQSSEKKKREKTSEKTKAPKTTKPAIRESYQSLARAATEVKEDLPSICELVILSEPEVFQKAKKLPNPYFLKKKLRDNLLTLGNLDSIQEDGINAVSKANKVIDGKMPYLPTYSRQLITIDVGQCKSPSDFKEPTTKEKRQRILDWLETGEVLFYKPRRLKKERQRRDSMNMAMSP